MPKVFFRGRVLPTPIQISFTDIPQVKWKWEEENLLLEFAVKITDSRIEIQCSLDHYKDEYLVELYRRSLDLARACVNVAAFGTGYGIALFLDTFVGLNGVPSILLFPNPFVVGECTAFTMNPTTLEEKKSLESILMIVMGEFGISMALNDLIQAISVPNTTPANCGRVLDGLRKMVTPGLEAKQGWPVFQEIIRADGAYLTFITEHSKNPRHGEHTRIDGPNTIEIATRTWKIMNRFLELKKRNLQKLPANEFPMLNG